MKDPRTGNLNFFIFYALSSYIILLLIEERIALNRVSFIGTYLFHAFLLLICKHFLNSVNIF